ncbi:hypothetical protein CIPAW_04G102700 [Carya illinoinensis]|uniref:Transmembrane protein n=1 Tax=Carya illinoinensis TaxID=32201 RepID=A0A8T1QSY9_CARIL|nr:hypothetical protein CIPAW_04G102700 [Carya illinoinensis]
MSLAFQNLFSNSPSRSTLSFTTTTSSSPPNTRTLSPPPISRCLSSSQNLTHLSLRPFNLAFFKTHDPICLRVYGSQAAARSDDVLGGSGLDSFLSIAELLCLVSSVAVLSIGFLANLAVLSSSKKAVLVEIGNRVSVWGFVFLAGGAAIGAWIRRRQWRGMCRETVKGGVHVNLLERVEKLEEDLRSSETIIRVLSRQLEKLGIRFRVTRKALKEPIAESCRKYTIRNAQLEGRRKRPQIHEFYKAKGTGAIVCCHPHIKRFLNINDCSFDSKELGVHSNVSGTRRDSGKGAW